MFEERMIVYLQPGMALDESTRLQITVCCVKRAREKRERERREREREREREKRERDG